MSRHLPLIALGLGAFLAFLVSLFPAETALRWFAPNNLRANDISGTIWSGSAQFVSIDTFAMRDLRWEIDALPLLLMRLGGAAQARLQNGFADTQFSISGESVELRNLQLSTSVATLSAVLPVSGASGAVSTQFSELDLERVVAQINGQAAEIMWPVSANGTIRISDLLVEPYAGLGNQLIPLGSYELDFADTAEESIQAQIRDLGGPLEFDGTLELSPSREYLLEGRIRTRADAPQSLAQGLNFMTGEPGADGWRVFDYPGSL